MTPRLTEAQKAARFAERTCACGAPALNNRGTAKCQECKNKAKAIRDAEVIATRRKHREDPVCTRCPETVPQDPNEPTKRMHDECRNKPPRKKAAAAKEAVERKCACGGEPRKTRGPAVCEECFAQSKPKRRICRLCRREFRTTNNTTTCNPCTYERKKALDDAWCACGAVIDRRSNSCVDCRYSGWHDKPLGSKRLASHGYVEIKTEKGWLREHVHVMEEMIGRRLMPGENVHHINGVRDDNRPENLELWVKKQPAGQRVSDLLAWAREIIALYGDLDL